MATACITNNLPYPVVDPSVSIEVEGVEQENIAVDAVSHTINITLGEDVDICNVKINSLEIACPDGVTKTVSDKKITEGTHDLSGGKCLEFTLSNYPGTHYKWGIFASQSIERYFSVNGQVGASVIDTDNHRVLVYVTKKTKLSVLEVKSIKLGPADIATYSVNEGDHINLLDGPASVDVTAHSRTEKWEIYAEKTELNVFWQAASPWTRCIYVRANGLEDGDNGFCYRKTGDEEWIDVEAEYITYDGGVFTACIDGLEPLTSYECYAYCGNDKTEVKELTTEDERTIPNGGLEYYSHAESNIYYSFFDPSFQPYTEAINEKFWDSGNIGSTAVGKDGIICYPDGSDLPSTGSTNSARLESKYVVVKFAAGNLYTGEFAGLVGTSGGKVNFGRPWTHRPRKFKLWIKSEVGDINHGDMKDLPDGYDGKSDLAEIFVALGDWDFRKYGGTAENPVQVNTTIASTLFNPEGPNVIAYGKHNVSKSAGTPEGEVEKIGWRQIEIPLDYYDCFRKPTHIIILCAASKYGDFFTGCDQNKLWVDDMEFEY